MTDLIARQRDLEAAISRVRALHQDADWCSHCAHQHPCPTIRALNGQTEENR